MLNTAQRGILKIALSLGLAQGLFAPLSSPWVKGRGPQLQVDWSLLFQRWGVTLLAVTVLCLIFTKRTVEGNESFFEMLRGRKLLSSLVLGLGLPIPILGVAAGFVGAMLLVEGIGFESAGVVLIFLVSFPAITSISLVLLTILQHMKSVRARTATVISTTVVVICASVITPFALSYREYQHRLGRYKSEVAAREALRCFNHALGTYKDKHGEFPNSLVLLRGLPGGDECDRAGGNVIQFPLPAESTYSFEYKASNGGGGQANGYVIYADPLVKDNRYGWPVYFYTDQNEVIHGCAMCKRAGPEDFVYGRDPK